MSAQSKNIGYQDGKEDGSTFGAQERNLVRMDADYRAGYKVGFREAKTSVLIQQALPDWPAAERQKIVRKVLAIK